MFILLLRTVIIYVFLLITMRLMGKRQLGELEISELVSTLLLSDIASLPITNQEIPLTYAIVPILTISVFEIGTSLLLTKLPRIKALLSTRPSMVIRQGKIDHRELLKNRISIDELISELRQKDITDIEQVDYAIIEQNGKMTVIEKEQYEKPTRQDLGIKIKRCGLCHVVITDGSINRHGLRFIKKDEKWLEKILREHHTDLKSVYLLTVDDSGSVRLILQNQVISEKKGTKP